MAKGTKHLASGQGKMCLVLSLKSPYDLETEPSSKLLRKWPSSIGHQASVFCQQCVAAGLDFSGGVHSSPGPWPASLRACHTPREHSHEQGSPASTTGLTHCGNSAVTD